MKQILVVIGFLTSAAYGHSWTGACYQDGKMFAEEVAAIEYCIKQPEAAVSEMAEVGAVELCDSPSEIRALESGCKDAVIPAIQELYDEGECDKFKSVKDSRVRVYSLMKRLCQ
ncbi:MAG TPA: hypothetical protein VE954_12310 [Oligoflexus sp.]|uniref:hypothetical protein n=1 Tax=Oligoflexus sp. TaxID=1971216 RepID=UPI002D41B1F0|nr:hypothetical protein [Oligoflexus sp.]HYX33890.1 hypothetical protein [Oligoflexus sp.]